jgi:hypothetical protein
MMASLSDLGRNVMDRDDPVEDHNDNKDKQSEGEIIQEWIANHFPLPFGFRNFASYRIEIGQTRFVGSVLASAPQQTWAVALATAG